MENGNFGTTRAFSRLFVDQPDPFCLEFFEGLFNIFHAEGNVLDSLSLCFDEFSDWAIRRSRFEKLDFGFSYRKEGRRYLLLRNSLASEMLKPENIGIELLYFLDTAHRNTDVINFEYLHNAS